jgi:hypothetical protein
MEATERTEAIIEGKANSIPGLGDEHRGVPTLIDAW